MRFAIFTHVEHSEREGQYFAYAPYVREMDVWLKHMEEVEVVAPLPKAIGTKGEKPPDLHRGSFNGKAYQHSHLNFTRIPSFHFLNLKGAVKAIIKIPYILYKILGAMKRADHLHLRCPGNIGLLACICQIFFPSKPKSAKYAGNWDPEAKQPWSYRFQKWLLSNTFLTRNMQVLVYGEWPKQSNNIVPFFTASFSEREKTEVPKKVFSEPFIFLFVGNLVEGKRPLEAIKLVEKLNLKLREGTDQDIHASYIPMKLELYGDGPEREKLEAYVRENHLEQLISIKGNRSLEELKEAYQKAHFVILPSKSEGWPKAIAEAMFFGCIPISTPVSCVPWMLGGGSRGMLISGNTLSGSRVESENHEGENGLSVVSGRRSVDIMKICDLMKNEIEIQIMSTEAKKWSQEYTLERFEEAIKDVLNKEKFNV
ncbi:glycosyltransferase [Salinimicrobium sp. WS361]|uniref:glycosyltransferase n=1 Tax=Salinimicrobium sp. WS361 TaxID=3425123 RepID=UPI003D6DD113